MLDCDELKKRPMSHSRSVPRQADVPTMCCETWGAPSTGGVESRGSTEEATLPPSYRC